MTYSSPFKGMSCISGRQHNPGAGRQVKREPVSGVGRLCGLNNRAQVLCCFTMIRACHKIFCSAISFHYCTLWRAMFAVEWAILKLSVWGVTHPVMVLTLLWQSVLGWASPTALRELLNMLLKPSTKAMDRQKGWIESMRNTCQTRYVLHNWCYDDLLIDFQEDEKPHIPANTKKKRNLANFTSCMLWPRLFCCLLINHVFFSCTKLRELSEIFCI